MQKKPSPQPKSFSASVLAATDLTNDDKNALLATLYDKKVPVA